MLFWYIALAAIGLSAVVIAAGQLGLLRGQAPAPGLATSGRLAPPSPTPNSVSSQAALYPDHLQAGYAAIAPFTWPANENGPAALNRLTDLLRAMPGVTVVVQQPNHVRAEAQTRWLRFVDDIDLLLDDGAGVIHVRSASRLGRKDFGVNRARVEELRRRFELGRPPVAN